MNHPDSSMFAPLGSTPVISQNAPPHSLPPKSVSTKESKVVEADKIDSLRIEKDLIDLNTVLKSDKSKPSNNNKKEEKEKKVSSQDPMYIKSETEKKQKSMLSTIDQKKKELQKQKDTIEKLNHELELLNVPATKEMTSLQNQIVAIDRELSKASKIRKQKEMELLESIDVVTKLADEKEALTERLKSIIYDFESTKQKKLKELEDQLSKVGV